MTSNIFRGTRQTRVLVSIPCISVLAAFLIGCGGSSGGGAPADDKRFSGLTDDEYTEPLTDAVIGSPSGIVSIGADGGTTVVSDGGSGPSGGGGGSSSGSGGSSGGGPMGGDDGGGGVAVDSGPVGFGDGGADGGGGGFGSWHFDDCSPKSHFLVDSSGFGANAQQALKASCEPGISGLGVNIRTAKDIIQVPDEPQFTVSSRIGVAAWVHPNTVTGDQPIVLKRLNNQTSFSLGIHNSNIQMSVVTTSGKTIISQAPISAGTWTHVAGMYDGTFVFLFINGQQFGQVFVGQPLRDVFAPLRIGATTQTQHFDGIIDEVFVSTQAITASTLTDLACITRPSTLAVNPLTSGPVPFDTDVHYDINVTDNDVGFCQSKQYFLSINSTDPSINATEDNQNVPSINPGQTLDFGVEVSGSDSADPGVHEIPFNVFSFSGQFTNFENLSGQLTFDLTVPTGCFVFTRRELMITNTSVVDDPIRTFGVSDNGGGGGADGGIDFTDGGLVSPPPGVSGDPVPAPLPSSDPGASPAIDAGNNPSLGVWTFGHLMRDLAPSPAQAPAMTLALFQHWLTDQTVNGFTVSARPAIQQVLLDVWPKTPSGDLDLDQAPLTLQAIVNRIDVRNLSAGSAGEGRFVFAVNGGGFPQSFTIILEYNLPAQTMDDVLGWANLWHGLSSHPFPSEEYNAALEGITRRFAGPNASPGSVNGSNLLELRTNEIALSFQWELRAFALSSGTGFFNEIPLKETPDLSFNGTSTFADFVNQNAAAITALVPGATGNTVPAQFEGANFQAGSIFNTQIEWSAPGINDPNARFHASSNTCNGCHGPETNTLNFTMINPRSFGTEATLSPFLTGTSVSDPVTGQSRTLNDLGRRQADLTSLVCSADAAPPPPPPVDAGPTAPPAVDAGVPVLVQDASVSVKK
jgi:hypothetical protein